MNMSTNTDLNFKLDERLKQDSVFITKLELSEVRLINNSSYDWLILVPQVNNIFEITDLNDVQYNILYKEIRLVARVMQQIFLPDKLNIATIGNIVRQLHVHIVARLKDDELFPKTVWGCTFKPYGNEEINSKAQKIFGSINNHAHML